ncbi:MAG TPA: hypothetical protein DCQ33_04045 [Nitrospira sp.]|nr:hypothetical protein [Nitrospira sp.]
MSDRSIKKAASEAAAKQVAKGLPAPSVSEEMGVHISAASMSCWINSELHGFHDPGPDGRVSTHAERLMLIVSECSEALEELRKPEYDAAAFGSELADIVIRTFDLAVSADVDIGQAIQDKHAKNIKRPFRHGGKRL